MHGAFTFAWQGGTEWKDGGGHGHAHELQALMVPLSSLFSTHTFAHPSTSMQMVKCDEEYHSDECLTDNITCICMLGIFT